MNRLPYEELARRAWQVTVVTPSRWRHEYSDGLFRAEPQSPDGMELWTLPAVGRGLPQRHVYVTRPSRVLRQTRPDAVLVEAEPFSVPAWQWGIGAARLGIPFAVQLEENLDRPLPAPARFFRREVLRRAGAIFARSLTAQQLAEKWGFSGPAIWVPHHVPFETGDVAGDVRRESPPTVGFVGRLVEEKGVHDLLAAAERLTQDTRILIVGDGPLRSLVERSVTANRTRFEYAGPMPHARMASWYRQMDLLIVPSRTTRTWCEQFGRVVIEALSWGVPVVGYATGEIPWLVELCDGGITVPEGDTYALATAVDQVLANPARARALGDQGRRRVEELFSVIAVGDRLEEILDGLLSPAAEAA